MNTTGIVREMDPLGRVVIPKELRRMHNITVKTPMEIFVEGEKIILQKYERNNVCIVTGEYSEENFSLGNGKIVVSKTGADELASLIRVFLNK